MNVNDSIIASMDAIKGKENRDQSAKNIFEYKPIMGNILKYTVEEYKDCSLEEIMACIEGDTIQTGTALVEEDMAQTIRGEKTELNTTDEPPATFDILFRSLHPKSKGNILINLHIDFEFQKDYALGYPVIKRGIYYGCRKLSAQLNKIGKNGEGYKHLEKVYSIWICLDRIPRKLQNTISYYKIQNYKNEGFKDNEIKINETEADLIEVVIVRLGGDAYDEKGLVDFLYGVFSGNQEKVLSYIPDTDNKTHQKEVSDMINLFEYVEEKGEERGRIEGEKRGRIEGEKLGATRMGTLIKILLQDKRYSDAERAAEDEEYRKQLYEEYNL